MKTSLLHRLARFNIFIYIGVLLSVGAVLGGLSAYSPLYALASLGLSIGFDPGWGVVKVASVALG